MLVVRSGTFILNLYWFNRQYSLNTFTSVRWQNSLRANVRRTALLNPMFKPTKNVVISPLMYFPNKSESTTFYNSDYFTSLTVLWTCLNLINKFPLIYHKMISLFPNLRKDVVSLSDNQAFQRALWFYGCYLSWICFLICL